MDSIAKLSSKAGRLFAAGGPLSKRSTAQPLTVRSPPLLAPMVPYDHP